MKPAEQAFPPNSEDGGRRNHAYDGRGAEKENQMALAREIPLKLCEILNKPFTRPRPPGRKSYEAYAEYEYSMAGHTLEELRPIDLKNKMVLDIGCGMGGKSVFLAEQGVKKLIAIDIETKRLEVGKEFAKQHGLTEETVSFEHADATNLSYQSETFDVVIANDSFEHLPDLKRTVEECFRVLKPGGSLGFNLLPYRSKDGAHLYDYIQIPWCQYLLPEPWLVSYWKKRFTEDYNSGEFRAFYCTPEELQPVHTVADLVQVNKLSLSEISRIVQGAGFRMVREERVCSQKLGFLKTVPGLNEFITYAYKVVYQKPQ